MANVKISDLTSAAAATGTQQFEVNDGFVSKKVTGAQILSYIEGEISSSPVLTGQVSLDDGTATAPSLTNTGDTNTGVFFPAADTVSIATGGTEALRVNSTQQMIVGGATADARLTVTGTGTTSTTPSTTTDIGAALGIRSSNAGSGNGGMLMFGVQQGYFASIKGFLQNGNGPVGALDFYTRQNPTDTTLTQRMRIDYNGNVGIGTTSPDAKFQVSGTSGSVQLKAGTDTNGYLEVNAFDSNPVYCVVAGSNATAGVFGTQTNIPTIFYSNNTERFRIGTSGQLGIGGANYGTSGQVLVSGGSGAAPSWGSVVTQGTVQTEAATGNSFTGIPSTAKIIIINISRFNPDSLGNAFIRVGTSSGFVTTGYISAGSKIQKDSGGGGFGATDTETTGFSIYAEGQEFNAVVTLTNLSGNNWMCQHTGVYEDMTYTLLGSGRISLSGVLDRVQVIPSPGTFGTSGTINILYY